MEFDQASAYNKAAIARAIFDKSQEVSPIISLDAQTPLAFVLLVLAAVFFGLYFNSTSLKVSSLFAALSSTAFAFGAIFLVDAVRVYTG